MNQFPVEVLEQIFLNLCVNQLKSVRQTCRHWMQIVDGSPTLMSRINFVPPIRVMDRNCAPIGSIRARNVTLKDATILTADSWWKSVGQDLTCLRLENCTISTETLVDMLGNASNLKYLCYACDNAVSRVETNFSLEKLEHLEVYSAETAILDIFGEICPRVKYFQFGQQNDNINLCNFLHKIKDSLNEIQLISAANILDDLLQLKHLSSLEIHSDTFDNETLTQIGASLPKLNHLRVTLRNQHVTFTPTFLNSMPILKSVTLFGEHRLDCASITIDFGSLEGHNLKKMYLTRLKPLNLGEYLQTSSQFNDLTLHYCGFENKSAIFEVIFPLKSLARLDLGKLRIIPDGTIYIVSDNFSSLKYLKLSNFSLSRQTLISFLERCENLEEVHISNLKFCLDEKIIQDVCHKWGKLKKLTLAGILIRDTTVNYIKGQCRNLKEIDVSGCNKKH